MKRKIFYCSFILTTLLMTGCGRNNEQPQSSATPETVTPSTEAAPPASSVQDNAKTMISAEEAKVIALNHADLVEEEVTFSKCELDQDYEGPNYDVEFYTEDRLEYDYEIDAYTGEILGYDWDGDDSMFTDATGNSDTNGNETNTSNTNETTDSGSTAGITEEAAKQIALEQVPGATMEHIREFDRDYDNGKLKYEVEIFLEDKEYEFDIDVKDGTILEREHK